MSAALATFFGILGVFAALSAFVGMIAAVSTLNGSVTLRFAFAAASAVLAALFIALSVYFSGVGA